MNILRNKLVPFFIATYLMTVSYFHSRLFSEESRTNGIRSLSDLETTRNPKASMLSKYASYMAITNHRIPKVENNLRKFNTGLGEDMEKELRDLDFYLSHGESQINSANTMADVASPTFDEFWYDQPPSSQPRMPPMHTWTWLPDTSPNANMSSIPKRIYKMFFQNAGGFPTLAELPVELISAHQSWKSHNPNYEVHYFDLILARRYLAKHFHPVFLRTFDCIEDNAGKTNLFRLAIVYREGGWYSDWKQICLQDKLLDKLSSQKADDGVFFKSKWSEEKGRVESTQNALFGATPRNPVIEKALAKLFKNVQSEYYGAFPTDATGAGVLGWAFDMVNIKRKKERKTTISHAGFFDKTNNFYMNDKAIVNHKCDNCSMDKDSRNHENDSMTLMQQRRYYCQSAYSIFTF